MIKRKQMELKKNKLQKLKVITTAHNILKIITAQTRKKIVRVPAGSFWQKFYPDQKQTFFGLSQDSVTVMWSRLKRFSEKDKIDPMTNMW